VAEAMMALVLADAALRQNAITEAAASPEQYAAELAWTDTEILRLLHRRRELVEAAGSRPLPDAVRESREQAATDLELPADHVAKVFDVLDGR
jgi:hypothetical protein